MAKKGISSASCKSKGRRLQDATRQILRKIGERYGLVDDDIKSAIMGCGGVDIVLSPAARKVFDLDIEAKNREQIVIPTVFYKHYKLYENTSALKLLVHKRNYEGALVTLRAEDFWAIYEVYLQATKPPLGGPSGA